MFATMKGDLWVFLRLVLALSIVGAHAEDYWPTALSGVGGSMAVEIFFVMSGFYMALVLSRTYAGRTRAFFIESRITDLSRVLASCSRSLGVWRAERCQLAGPARKFALGGHSDLNGGKYCNIW